LNARQDSPEMRPLRFQAAEEMYWRLMRGRDLGEARADKG
jgi:hypothetical protein